VEKRALRLEQILWVHASKLPSFPEQNHFLTPCFEVSEALLRVVQKLFPLSF
jgi:hypothetical protein